MDDLRKYLNSFKKKKIINRKAMRKKKTNTYLLSKVYLDRAKSLDNVDSYERRTLVVNRVSCSRYLQATQVVSRSRGRGTLLIIENGMSETLL